MFKCCVCNRSGKKSSFEADESDSKRTDRDSDSSDSSSDSDSESESSDTDDEQENALEKPDQVEEAKIIPKDTTVEVECVEENIRTDVIAEVNEKVGSPEPISPTRTCESLPDRTDDSRQSEEERLILKLAQNESDEDNEDIGAKSEADKVDYNERIDEPIYEPIYEPIDKKIDEPVEKPRDQPITESTDALLEEGIDDRAEESRGDLIDKSTGEPIYQTVVKRSTRTAEPQIDRPSESIEEREIIETLQEPAKESPSDSFDEEIQEIIGEPPRESIYESVRERESIPEPVEFVPEPISESFDTSIPEYIPEAFDESIPEQIPEPFDESIPEPIPESFDESLPEQFPEPILESLDEPLPAPIDELPPEPIDQLADEPMAESSEELPESVEPIDIESLPEPIDESLGETTDESIIPERMEEPIEVDNVTEDNDRNGATEDEKPETSDESSQTSIIELAKPRDETCQSPRGSAAPALSKTAGSKGSSIEMSSRTSTSGSMEEEDRPPLPSDPLEPAQSIEPLEPPENIEERAADVPFEMESIESLPEPAETSESSDSIEPPLPPLPIESIVAQPIPLASKINLYNGTGYIERTVDDGPDEEGDDSVFEPCPVLETDKLPPVRSDAEDEDEDGDVDVDVDVDEDCGGMQEPPATPVARDELALRRHRFFSDLLNASRPEHRVRFDPLGPMVHPGCEYSEREEHLEELVIRLENVTRRLERVNPPTQETAVQTNTPSPPPVNETCVEIVDMSVAGYEDLLAGPVQEYLQLSTKIGGDVAEQGNLVGAAFQVQLQFLKTAASRPAPSNQSEQVSLLSPTSTHIQKIQEYREKHRGSAFFNHLSAISESIPALGWVAVAPTPAPYVKEMNDAGQFYTNRVLKDWKEKDKTHVEWCKAWVQTLTELQKFVRQHHTTGLVWAKTGSGAAPACPPPPPPAMMPPMDFALSANDDRSALFAQINQGENITKNLKKVTSEMQTHKNPSLRTGPAPFKAPVVNNVASGKTVPPANVPIDKPPVFTRDGKKWLIEYHKGNKDLVVDNVEMNNVVYIFRCQESNVVIKGKVNSIVMDSCRKSAIVLDSVVASVEFVNCQSVQMQVIGKVPTISVDKTDGCQMYLSSESLDVEVITSKSSEMNIMLPKGNGDYIEHPVPEQFKTTIGPKGLNTIAIDSLG